MGDKVPGECIYATAFDEAAHRVVVGKELYHEIRFGHRVGFVRAADVRALVSGS